VKTSLQKLLSKRILTQNLLKKLKINSPYIIYIGNAYPHKNLEKLLDAFKKLFTLHSSPVTNLVIVCPRDVFARRLKEQIVSRNLGKNVITTGYLDAIDLSDLLQKADAYVFPSLSEGFGIPGLNAMVSKIPVVCSNIPTLKEIYQDALRRGVAHALGTSFPGQPGVTYLFAHSTDTIFNVPRFNAVFYLLNDIKTGERIVLFFNNKRFDYIVTESKITEPEDVSYFTMKTPEQILVMQTCYPPGTTWKRLLVIAKPAASALTININ